MIVESLERSFFSKLAPLFRRRQMFVIGEAKRNDIVSRIERSALKWVGETVVARSDDDGVYQLGEFGRLIFAALGFRFSICYEVKKFAERPPGRVLPSHVNLAAQTMFSQQANASVYFANLIWLN